MKCLVFAVTYLVLQTAFTGVTANAGDFKDVCTGASPPACNTGTDTCDASKCVRKIGQACTAGNADECVSTAVTPCPSSNKCECDATTTRANADNTKCLKLIGQQCTAPADCLVAGATCTGTPTVCGCPAGKHPKADNTECLTLLGQQCSGPADCVAADATCTGSPNTICGCPNGKSPNPANTVCSAVSTPAIAAGAVNGACKPSDQCDGALTCDKNADGGAKCKTKVGQTCAAKGDCIKNADCITDNAPCTCKAGFTANADKTNCTADSPPAIAAGAVNGACKTGGTCDGASLTCDKNADGGAKCKNKVGETCGAKVDCIKNADCTPASLCNCTAGYNVNTEKTVCESADGGSTSLTASMLLLAALFVTSRFL